MSVFKIEKTKDYTVMSNYHLRDKNLSYKAKGLLSFMLSLPDDWDYSLAGLCAISKESRDGIRAILKELQVEKVDGILLDIGVSSHQLDTPGRGFSFHNDAPLDMRMSQKGPTAADLVNNLSAEELAKIFFEYGEEKFSRSIASGIVKARTQAPIETTLQLAQVISDNVPAKAKRQGHPARQCFQALRIAVNRELDVLSQGLDGAFSSLKVGGRLSVITFHSLEDRMVKQRFAGLCKGCTCPPEFPVCVCGKTPAGKLPFKNPVSASEQELQENQRARSAKLRTVEKLKEADSL